MIITDGWVMLMPALAALLMAAAALAFVGKR